MSEREEPRGSRGPLGDLVVLDFTWQVAGPQGTRLIGDWGADVIRIEWPGSPDMMRFMGAKGSDTPEQFYEAGGTIWRDVNSSKRGLTLNMRSEAGKAIFVEMLKKADAVVENFSPQAMEKWGFTYETMRQINPRIIYMSVSGFGHTESPQKYYLSYGPAAQAHSGLTHGSGLPGDEPAGWGFSYMDNTAGYINAIALMMAVIEREKSGVGQHLDLSQIETGIALTGAAFLDWSVNGRSSRRPGFPPGNRASWPGHEVTWPYRADPLGAPHNTYRTRPSERTAGDASNDWCAITCFTDAQWQALARTIGREDLLGDSRFATLESRLANQQAFDAIIEDWTLGRDKFDVMYTLQEAGVPAGAVQSSRDRIVEDPQLKARRMHKEVGGHPFWGSKLFQNVPVHMSRTPPELRFPAPFIGQHNEEILGELLGYTPEKVRQLVDEGTLWPKDTPRPRWIRGRQQTDDEAEAMRLAGE